MLYSGRKFFELRMVFRPTWKSAVTVNVQFLWVACCIANSHPCLIPQQVQQFLSMHMFFRNASSSSCQNRKLHRHDANAVVQESSKFQFHSGWDMCSSIHIYIYIVISRVRSLDCLGNEAAALRPTVDSLPAPAAHRTDESYRITECLSAKTHDMRCIDMTYDVVHNLAMIWCPLQHHKKTVFVFCACFLQINAISCSRIDRDIYIYIYEQMTSDITWIHVKSQRFLSFVPKLQLWPGCSSPQGQHPALYRLAEILYPLNEMIHEELVHWIGGMVQARFDDLSFRIRLLDCTILCHT